MTVNKRPLTDAEAIQLNIQIPENFSDYLSFNKGMDIYDGPLSFYELALEQSLFILGDLNVEKTLSVPQNCSLVVTGSLKSGAIVAVGKVVILGELDAGDVYGDSFSNQVFCCKGNARVHCLIEKGHDFEFEGDLSGKCVASISNVVRIGKTKKIKLSFLNGMDDQKRREVFVPEVFDSNGVLKGNLIVFRILDGKPLLQKND
jgi:hypothetical protein